MDSMFRYRNTVPLRAFPTKCLSHVGVVGRRACLSLADADCVDMERSPLHSESILIVDDVPTNLKLMSVLLSKLGYQVHTASTAEEALEIAQKIRPRLVLADILLPGMDGLEMTRRLKSAPETKSTVVLAVTALAMKGDEQKALAAGCDGYITKPIDVHQLPVQVAKILGGSGFAS